MLVKFHLNLVRSHLSPLNSPPKFKGGLKLGWGLRGLHFRCSKGNIFVAWNFSEFSVDIRCISLVNLCAAQEGRRPSKFSVELSPLTTPLLHIKKLGRGSNCIKVYPRGQIAEIHLHFNTLSAKNLNEIVTTLHLHCNLH